MITQSKSSILHWAYAAHANNDPVIRGAVEMLLRGGKAVVTPTNVGYIIMTTDRGGLEKKFDLKNRSKKKPGVVLCSSLVQLQGLAEIDSKIHDFYINCNEADLLIGCILPWKNEALKHIPEGCEEFVRDDRGTSCFVINFGLPSEEVAEELWDNHQLLSFASSANPSGQGNRGKFEGVGERILEGADLIIEADYFVATRQPDKNEQTRFAQGVMVDMTNAQGELVDEPVLIREGYQVNQIMAEMRLIWKHWHFMHGQYH